MPTPTQTYKLGVFILSALVLLVATLMIFADSRWRRTQFPAFTEFQESVQGLDVAAPVKFRGVTIGRVSQILLQEPELSVRVNMELYNEALQLQDKRTLEDFLQQIVKTGARCRLELINITGLKYVEIDFFSDTTPAAATPRQNSEHFFIPSVPSLLTGLQTDLSYTLARLAQVDFAQLGTDLQQLLAGMNRFLHDDRLHEILEHLVATSARIDSLVETIETQFSSDQLAATMVQVQTLLSRLDELIITATRQIASFDSATLSDQTQALLGELRTTAKGLGEAQVNFQRTMEQIQFLAAAVGAGIEAANIEHTADEIRNALQIFSELGGTVGASSNRFADLVEQLTQLIGTLETDPGALLHGRRSPPVQMGRD